MTNVTLPVLLDDHFAPDDDIDGDPRRQLDIVFKIRPAKYSSPAGPALLSQQPCVNRPSHLSVDDSGSDGVCY